MKGNVNMSIKMKELPKAERPYEKLEQYGEKTLTNAELLAIIIKTGTKDETAIGLAQKILKLNAENEDNLRFLLDLTLEELMKIKDVAKGGGNFVSTTMKSILNEAVKIEASKIILIHNHPSGDPTPSEQDLIFTKKVEQASKILGIQLLDHIVLGDMKYVSIFSSRN